MLPDKWKSWLRGGAMGPSAPPSGPSRSRAPMPPSGDGVFARPSRGLEGFFGSIRDRAGLTILDLGGATQENVSFITNLGHRLYSEDFLHTLAATFEGADPAEQSNSRAIESFLEQTLAYPAGQFDGVLIWDAFEYLSPAMLEAVIARLQMIVRPSSCLLAIFNSDERAALVPCCDFRIVDVAALQVTRRGVRRPVQLYNNRGVERLLGRFDSMKFFLARDGLREVLVKV
jgi:hypothetical protein